jgi:hypothetical protein
VVLVMLMESIRAPVPVTLVVPVLPAVERWEATPGR